MKLLDQNGDFSIQSKSYPKLDNLSRSSTKSLPGFTLTELLIVLVIVGILVLMALPSLTPLISKTKSTEAKLQLKHLYTLQQTYFYTYSKYSEELSEIGFEQIPTVDKGGNANYEIEIVESDHLGYVAQATSIVDFDSDGNFNVWQINQDQELVEVIPD